jgi:hypothetical protein
MEVICWILFAEKFINKIAWGSPFGRECQENGIIGKLEVVWKAKRAQELKMKRRTKL